MADLDNLPQADVDQDTSSQEEGSDDKKPVEETKKEDTFNPFEQEEDKGKKEEVADDTPDVDIDEEDRKVMQAVVKEENKSVISKLDKMEVDTKVNNFLSDEKNKVYRDYQEKIRTYAKSPAAKGLTAEAIARLAVNPRDMIAKGAEEERKASKESRDSVSPGSTARTPEGSDKVPNAWKMSQDKFKETIEKAKRNR